MAQIIHNISTPNDGLGDELRTAFDHQNEMNTDLYTNKVDKVTGKDLSENDFTDALKLKLENLNANAEQNVQADWLQGDDTADDYIKNKPTELFSSVGYFHISNSLTSQSVSGGVATDLLNNNLGVYSSSAQAPYGITQIWNTTTNAFDFSQLSLGDMVSLRADLFIDTTATNQDFRVYITLGIGTESEYSLLLNQTTYKGAVSNYAFLEEVTFSIDNEDWRTAPAKISVLTDASASVLVNGWYVPIIRKSVNVIDITGTTPNLQQVTDIGNTTTNNLYVTDGLSTIEVLPTAIYIGDTDYYTNLSSAGFSFSDNLFASNILFRTRTTNTTFFFEDEGGEKSIATREWVNANNYRKWLVKDTMPTAAVTGTTSITQIGSSILIPANTFGAKDVMILEAIGVEKIGTLGTCSIRLYQNTSNTLSGATLIASASMVSANLSSLIRRTFEVNSGFLKGLSAITPTNNDYAVVNASRTNTPFNPAIDNYFFTTVQLGNASDSVTRTQLLISK